MAKLKAKKESELASLKENFKTAKTAIFSVASGLTVSDSQELRRKLKSQQVVLQVGKKTLLKKALEDNQLPTGELEDLRGNVAVAFGLADEVAPAKALAEFAKTHEKLQLKFGLLEGQVITLEKVKQLASLPGKTELLAKLVGTIKAPVNGLVNVLAGNLRGLVNVLNAIKDAKN